MRTPKNIHNHCLVALRNILNSFTVEDKERIERIMRDESVLLSSVSSSGDAGYFNSEGAFTLDSFERRSGVFNTKFRFKLKYYNYAEEVGGEVFFN